MLKLVLWLACLLRFLLLLNQGVSVFRFVGASVARFGLHPLVLGALPVFLRSCRVLAVRRGLQVLALRLGPLRMLVLNRARLVLILFLHIRAMNALLLVCICILLHALAASRRHSRRQSLAI